VTLRAASPSGHLAIRQQRQHFHNKSGEPVVKTEHGYGQCCCLAGANLGRYLQQYVDRMPTNNLMELQSMLHKIHQLF
jgi:hypothetical protein